MTLPGPTSHWILLIYSISQALVPVYAFAQPQGTVDCTLEWHSGRQTYTYVFTGVVRHQNKPCPNAHVQLQISSPNQPDTLQETVAAADGTYQLKVALAGVPEQSTDWKLVAQGPEIGAETVELAGRYILSPDENTVVVDRPIQLVQG